MKSLQHPVVLSFFLCYLAGSRALIGPVAIKPSIVGGSEATDGQFPYQVALMKQQLYWCGASIITQSYVLTAAHCVTVSRRNSNYAIEPAATLFVRAGSSQMYSGGVLVNVSEVIVHPEFKFPHYDAALLKLATPLNNTDNIQALSLAKEQPPLLSSIIASGWGLIHTDGPSSVTLQYVTLRSISDASCAILLRESLSTTMCCMSWPGRGICQGDSGGPAVYNNTLVGLMSFTPGDCGKLLPDGFTQVWVLRDWIAKNSDWSE